MLEEITATCADLLLRASSPVHQFLTVDEDASSTSDYQRFKFVESLVLSESFDNALSQILYSPDIHWSSLQSLQGYQGLKRQLRPSLNR